MNRAWKEKLNWNEEQLTDLRSLGYSYIMQGFYSVGKEIFEALVVLSDENLYDLQTLGSLYLEMGNNKGALELIDKALTLDPKNEKIQLNRAKALFGLRYDKLAVDQAKQLLKHQNSAVANKAAALISSYA